MKLTSSDPDIQTLMNRIRDDVLDLQPDFQRQEVWSDQKKRRLIDSILRQWHVPPVHVVVDDDGKENVLDGQQRLAAIRDFATGKILVDGTIEPLNERIQGLHGLSYDELPEKVRREFDRFTIRYYRIEDHAPEEPGELFYRLNQPTNLTTAEQRNAFFGPARKSIREFVDLLAREAPALGFTNARMAHDDVIARVCFTLHVGSLVRKVTANDITEIYRSSTNFNSTALQRTRDAIESFCSALNSEQTEYKFNKASLYSWLCFVAGAQAESKDIDSKTLGSFLRGFESRRKELAEGLGLLAVFNDRASSRVADVSSVLARDFVLWFEFLRTPGARDQLPVHSSRPKLLAIASIGTPPVTDASDVLSHWVAKCIERTNWGATL